MWQPMVSSEKEMNRDDRHVQKVMESCTDIEQLKNARQWFLALEDKGFVGKRNRVYLVGLLRGLFVGIKREAE